MSLVTKQSIIIIIIGCLLVLPAYFCAVEAYKVPQWVNKLFSMYSKNQITKDDINNAVKYLIEKNLVQIGSGKMQIDNSKKNTSKNSTKQISDQNNLPKPIKSWQIDSQIKNKITGQVEITESKDGNFLEFSGNGYLKENVGVLGNLTGLTLSCWIKPSYEDGAQKFTLIGKQNAFDLAINNNFPPAKHATFSIFDGIKWTSITSNSTIPEKWTHLAATFDGNSIKIFVNGKMESSDTVIGIPVFTVNGLLTNKSTSIISSNYETSVGTYYDRDRGQTRDLFSGDIKDIKIFDTSLSPSQINQIYKYNENTIIDFPSLPSKSNSKDPLIITSDKQSYSKSDMIIISGIINTKMSGNVLPLIIIVDSTNHPIITAHPKTGPNGEFLLKTTIDSSFKSGNYTAVISYGKYQEVTKFFINMK